jgi:hypothetical protein
MRSLYEGTLLRYIPPPMFTIIKKTLKTKPRRALGICAR